MAPVSSKSITRYLHPFRGEPPSAFGQQPFTSEEAWRKLPHQNALCAVDALRKRRLCLSPSQVSSTHREHPRASTRRGHTVTCQTDQISTCWSGWKTSL